MLDVNTLDRLGKQRGCPSLLALSFGLHSQAAPAKNQKAYWWWGEQTMRSATKDVDHRADVWPSTEESVVQSFTRSVAVSEKARAGASLFRSELQL
jgi:hypothetical protein